MFKPTPFNHISDNVVKNCATEIIRECKNKGVELDQDNATYAVCLLSLNPISGLSQQTQFDRHIVHKFVNSCVEKFCDSENTCIKTLKMQVVFMKRTTDLLEVKKKYKAITNQRLDKLYQEITAFTNTDVDYENLIRKMCTQIIVKNKLGKPSNPKVFEESMNALKSVITSQDITDYIEMKKSLRQAYMKSLGLIISGIRIFNKHNGQCGEGVRDITADLLSAYKNTQQNLNDSGRKVGEIIKIGSRVLRFAIDVNLQTAELKMTLPTQNLIDELYNFNKYLILIYQYQHFLDQLIDLINKTRLNLDFLVESFRNVIFQIHEVVQFRIAVPTDMVFPHFTELANIWHMLLSYLYLMVEINTLNDKLSELIKISYNGKEIGLQLLEISKNLYKPNVVKDKHKELINELQPINPETDTVNPLEKFCAYSFVKTNGLLVTSDLTHGVMEFNKTKYAFYKREYANLFEENIKETELEFMKIVHSNPEFIYFFKLLGKIQNFNLNSLPEEGNEQAPVVIKETTTTECQTETHPIASLIDKNYFWNVWDIRREAIHLANIRNCVTKSVQTNISYQCRNHLTQTDVLKSQDIQTLNDKKV